MPIEEGAVTIQSETEVAKTLPVVSGFAKFESVNPDRYFVKIVIAERGVINMVKDVNTGAKTRMKVMVPAV